MTYRAEIDGLRALAVVTIVLFHAGFDLFSGGYVGVDIFFVISGYLITTILINDISNHRFSLIEFYERRLRRILPAFFLVTLICTPFAWNWMFPNDQREYFQSLFAVSVFASNFLFWKQEDYFASTAEEKPLLHTWSLAVEEQYYLVFPVFMFLAWRFGKNRVFWSIVLIAALSLALSEWGWRNAPVANFYLLPTRAWELLAGSIAAFLIHRNGVKDNNLLSTVGFIAILFSIFFYDETTAFPSIYALVPVVGTVLLVMFAGTQTLAARILSYRLLVGIGLISYSVYLWHQPLFAFARLRTISEPGGKTALFLIGVTFLLAYFTWKYVETPVRKKTLFSSRKSIFSTAFVALAVFAVSGTAGNFLIERGDRSTPSFLKKYEARSDYIANNYYLLGESFELQRRINGISFFGVDNIPTDNVLLFDTASDKNKILVVGNSHSVDFYNVLSFSQSIEDIAQVARYGIQIEDIGDTFFSSPNYTSADTVVYCSLFSNADINNIERVISRSIADGKKTAVCKNIFTWIARANHTDLDRLIVYGMNENLPNEAIAARINASYTAAYRTGEFIDEDRKQAYNSLQETLDKLSGGYDFQIIDRMDYVCATGTCEIVSKNLGKYFFDLGHHTLDGARHFASVIDKAGLADELIETPTLASEVETNE